MRRAPEPEAGIAAEHSCERDGPFRQVLRASSSTRRRCALLAALVLATVLANTRAGQADRARPAKDAFEEAAQETGLDFQHFIGATGAFLTPEILGSGAALLDFDGDGDLDVYLLQGAQLDRSTSAGALLSSPPAKHWPGNRLFRNEIVPTGKLRFVDVTEKAGVGDEQYGMGAAVGDYDNDGDPDLFVTNFGSNVLFRNNGDGTFSNVSREAGVDDDSFSASAAFVDYDQDGDLDLFVTRYYALTLRANKACYNHAGGRDYCGPGEYPPLPDRLYRNDGNGRFTDVSRSSGITAAYGNGLGVVCADFNGDGRIDIYVANDKTPNQLWINQGNGRFEDEALIAGAAYSGDGKAEAGMGVTAGDFDNDGDEDIFVTHLAGETSTLYRNAGDGTFDDITNLSGLGQSTRPYTGFGTLWFDFDNDGDLDLFSANGDIFMADTRRHGPFPYDQPNQLFRNERGRFEDVSARAGAVFALSEVSRGAAFGDLDNDGDIDIVVTNAAGPARLLLNQAGSQGHWMRVKTIGTKSNRDGYGARVALIRKGRRPVWRRISSDGSYLSANDPRAHFGLGDDAELRAAEPERILVVWPSGTKESWAAGPPGREVTLREGSGEPVP